MRPSRAVGQSQCGLLLAPLLFLCLAAGPRDPVAASLESFQNLTSYSAILRSGHGDAREIVRYFYKKPGFVRMEFVTPHKGALLVYSPATKTVRLRPFGFAQAFTLSLSPDNFLVKSAEGHRVDASDLGSLLARVQVLQARGEIVSAREESPGGERFLAVEVAGKPGEAVDGVHRYRLWLDESTWLPRKVLAFGPAGELVEEVSLEDLVVNPSLGDELFAF